MIAYRSYHQRKSYAFLPGFLVRLEFLGGILSCRSPPFLPRIMNGSRPTFGEAWRNAGGYLCYGQISHPGVVSKLPLVSCHRKWQILSFPLFYDVLLESQITCGAMKESNPGVTTIRVILVFRVTICLNSIFVGVTDWLFRQPEWKSSESSEILFSSLIWEWLSLILS